MANEPRTTAAAAATFSGLSLADQEAVRKDAEERCVSCAFLRQSGAQRGKLKVDLQNDFTTGDNHHPKTCQQTLHLLDTCSKTAASKLTNSEGASFAQGGGGGSQGKKKTETCDEACWKGKTCYNCNGKDHPSSFCPEKTGKSGKPKKSETDDDDDDAASTASSVNKLKKDFKKMSKAFATVNAKS